MDLLLKIQQRPPPSHSKSTNLRILLHFLTLPHQQFKSPLPPVPPPGLKSTPSTETSDKDQYSNAMSAARDIAGGLTTGFANQLNLSVSPTSTFHSPSSSFGPRHMAAQKASKKLKPFNTGDVRILLLENVNETAQEILKKQGYQVEFHKSSLLEEELIEKIRYAISAPT